jgi:hypothetical protein
MALAADPYVQILHGYPESQTRRYLKWRSRIQGPVDLDDLGGIRTSRELFNALAAEPALSGGTCTECGRTGLAVAFASPGIPHCTGCGTQIETLSTLENTR